MQTLAMDKPARLLDEVVKSLAKAQAAAEALGDQMLAEKISTALAEALNISIIDGGWPRPKKR